MKIITRPTTISATMATILMSANQNSVSPKALTVGRFSSSRMTMVAMPGIHSWMPGHSSLA